MSEGVRIAQTSSNSGTRSGWARASGPGQLIDEVRTAAPDRRRVETGAGLCSANLLQAAAEIEKGRMIMLD